MSNSQVSGADAYYGYARLMLDAYMTSLYLRLLSPNAEAKR